MSASVGQEMHADDLVNLMYFEDLRDVILVGHSYGGIVITLAAERTDRIGQLVYLDAIVPRDQDTFIDCLPKALRAHVNVPPRGELHTYPVIEGFKETMPGWAAERLTPQPAMDLDRPILLPSHAAEQLPRTYFSAGVSGPQGDWDEAWIERVQQPPWRFKVFDSDHEAMLNAPALVMSLLLSTIS